MEHLIRVKSRVVTAQILGLEKLDWFDGSGGDYMVMTVDAGEPLFKEFKRTAESSAQKIGGFSEDHFSVVQLQSCCGGRRSPLRRRGLRQTTLRSRTVRPACFMRSSSLKTSDSELLPVFLAAMAL